MDIEKKLKELLEERETILNEMQELQKAFASRQERIIEIAGSIKIIQEMLTNNEKENNKTDIE